MTFLRGFDRRIFIDSSAFFALYNDQDGSHARAAAIQTRLLRERWRLFTTNAVVAETHALTLSRLDRVRASTVLSSLDSSSESGALRVIRVRVSDERRAREIIHRYDDKDFSLTDALSFAVMERLSITTAFSFDRDFGQFGLNMLSP